MNELIGRLVAEHGIDRDVAEKAVGIILAFLIKEGPADKVKPLIDRMPGAQAAADASGGGGFGMGGIMGAGAAQRLKGVRWQVGQEMVLAWLLTIPVSGLVAAGCYFLIGFFS